MGEAALELTYDESLGLSASDEGRLPALREYVVVAALRRAVSVSRRAGDLWAFEDRIGGDALTLASLDLALPVDVIYRDALGTIVD